MDRPCRPTMQKDTLKSLLETFERTIDENNRVGVNSRMYLAPNTGNHLPKTSDRIHVATRKDQRNDGKRKDQRNDGKKTMPNVAILTTLDEMTDLADEIINLSNHTTDHSVRRNTTVKKKPVTMNDECDEMSITSFHSGSRRPSSIISRPVSIESEVGCGSSNDSRNKNIGVIPSSTRIVELPRDIQIRSSDYDTTDDDESDGDDSDDDDDAHPTVLKSRFW
jgi:hypothetical protein